MKKKPSPKKAVKKVKPRNAQYNEKTEVTGSFLDVMKAAAKHAKNGQQKP